MGARLEQADRNMRFRKTFVLRNACILTRLLYINEQHMNIVIL